MIRCDACKMMQLAASLPCWRVSCCGHPVAGTPQLTGLGIFLAQAGRRGFAGRTADG